MLHGTCADMRPRTNIFSFVSGWKAESYRCFASQISSSDKSGKSSPFLKETTSNFPDECVLKPQQRTTKLNYLCTKIVDKTHDIFDNFITGKNILNPYLTH